jgi:uncharacterized membrane protein YhaH (DUF805 family)
LINLFLAINFIAMLPLQIRRLQDAGKAWPWIFIGLVPVIGGIWMIFLLSLPSTAPLVA